MGLGDLKEMEDYFGIKREPPAPARLDADKTAKPLTEIVGVYPAGETNWYHNASELVARPVSDGAMHQILSAYDKGVREGMVVGAAIIAWAEAIRTTHRTEPCEWCGKPTAAWRAMCDDCENDT